MAVIGYDQIAGTSGTTATNWINECQVGAAHRFTAASGDTVTKVWAYGGGTGDCEIGVYVFSGGVPTTKVGSAAITIGATLGWYSADVSWALTAGVEYCVAIDYQINAGAEWDTYYDVGNGTISIGNSSAPLPSTWTQNNTDSYRMSYYAEVTLGGGGATVPDAVDDLAGTPGDTQVVLTWTAPADGGAAITDYVVQYREV